MHSDSKFAHLEIEKQGLSVCFVLLMVSALVFESAVVSMQLSAEINT